MGRMWMLAVVLCTCLVMEGVKGEGDCPVKDGRKWGCVPCFGELEDCKATCNNYCTTSNSTLTDCLSSPPPQSVGWVCVDLDKCDMIEEGDFQCVYQSGLSDGDIAVIVVGCVVLSLIVVFAIGIVVRTFLLRRRLHSYHEEVGDHDLYQSHLHH